MHIAEVSAVAKAEQLLSRAGRSDVIAGKREEKGRPALHLLANGSCRRKTGEDAGSRCVGCTDVDSVAVKSGSDDSLNDRCVLAIEPDDDDDDDAPDI